MSKRVKKIAKRKPPSLFIPGLVDGKWSKFDAWLRAILIRYMQYREITKPMLSADGQPMLDSFGRTRLAADAPAEIDGIKKGAVWFTRETMRMAWFDVFGALSHRDESPDHYEPRVREPNLITGKGGQNYVNYSHPMDSYVVRMKEDHRLVTPNMRNRFMLSRAECERLELPEAWGIHMERGKRWEGLHYVVSKVDISGIRRRAVRDSNITIKHQPDTMLHGVRHAKELLWREVLHELRSWLYFDVWDVVVLAAERGLVKKEQGTATTATHLSRWVEQGKVNKVLPRLYQSAAFDMWHRQEREKYQKPKVKENGSWMIEWLRHWSTLQPRLTNGSYFTSESIFQYFTDEADADIEMWMERHHPNGIRMTAIRNQLTTYRKEGYIESAGRIGFRVSKGVVRLFEPLWRDWQADAMHENYLKLVTDLHELSIEKAIEGIPDVIPSEALFAFMDRIRRDVPNEWHFFNHLRAVAKKIKRGPAQLWDDYQAYQREKQNEEHSRTV